VSPLFAGFLTALGAGLLIGLVRERRRNDADSGPSSAGLRTHALAALSAAVAWQLDPRVFLALFVVSGALVAISYHRTAQADVGLTSEFALVLTVLIGALAMVVPGLASGLAVVAAILLHLRNELHHLGRELISEHELHDGLLLAAAVLVVLPLLPTEAADPWGVIVPSELWTLVAIVMAAGMAGEVALRTVGARFGLPVAGFFAGFASSTAATASYGRWARSHPALLPFTVSAALLANVATLILLAVVLAAGSPELLRGTAWPLAAAGGTLLVAGAAGILRRRSHATEPPASEMPQVFKLSHALLLVGFVAALLILSAVLSARIGDRGALAAAAVAGMVELQGAALAIGQLTEIGRMPLADARWGVVVLLASSSAAKAVLAFMSGGRAYGIRVAAGLGTAVVAAVLAARLTMS
jgi:uncharacterized membrane protein (DUF4010 family)